MGIPVRPGATALDLLTALLDKARRKFWANRDLLLSSAPLRRRLHLLYRTVWASMSWIIGTITPSQHSLEFLNTFLYSLVVKMGHIKRRPTELFVEYTARSVRLARYLVHQSGLERWSSLHLRQMWRYTGHRCRGLSSPHPGASAYLTHFRTHAWWQEQQLLLQGVRHKRRHYPRLTSEEKFLSAVFKGQDWRPFAENKDTWKSFEQSFLELHDVAWSSTRQLALENLL